MLSVSAYNMRRMLSASRNSLPAVSPLDLVGVPEIAELLGVSRPSVWRYVRREDFPKPDAQVSGKRLWRRSTVERWAKKTLPLKFDPRSQHTSRRTPRKPDA
jgi:predicted DNA-binding transcriptional regulator AlpA